MSQFATPLFATPLFATPFSVWRYLVSFQRYSQLSSEVVWNLPHILMFLGCQIFWGRARGAREFLIQFLLLAHNVPNVAKRSMWDQCKKKYILRSDRRPTDLSFGPYWGNFKWPYLSEGSSDPLHVWFYGGVFEVGGSNGAISGFAKSKMAAQPPSGSAAAVLKNLNGDISAAVGGSSDLLCLVLGRSCRGRWIEWR